MSHPSGTGAASSPAPPPVPQDACPSPSADETASLHAALEEERQARKDAEQRLTRSEERYRSLVETIDQGYCIIEVLFGGDGEAYDCRFLEVNQAFEKQTGLANAVGKTVKEMVPGNEAHWFETYGRVARTGEAERFEDAAEALGRCYDVFALRIGAPEEHRVGVLVTDIAERKRAEEALRESEERYRRLFENMVEGFAIGEALLDEAGEPYDFRFLQTNQAFHEETGLGPDAVGRPMREVLPDLEQSWVDTYCGVALSGEPVRFENYNRDTDRHYDVQCFQAAPGRFAILFRDVSVRRRVEEALRESEELIRLSLSAARAGAWTWDLHSNAVQWSEDYYRLFGLEPGSIEPSVEAGLGRVHPEDRLRVEAAIQEAMQRGTGIDVTHRVVWPDGSTRWVRGLSQVFRDEQAQPRRMAGLAMDVSAEQEVEHERQRHLSEIEDLNVRLQRAMAETHHRVKNNLQTIAALVDMATAAHGEQVPAEEVRGLSQHVRGLAAIHDLLTTQAKEGGRADCLSARTAIQKLLPILQAGLGGRRLQTDLADVAIPVRKATALALVVNELVSNATKHAPNGDITVRLRAEGEAACLMVEDQGPGFSPGFVPERDARTGLDLVLMLSGWDLGGKPAFGNREEGGARVSVTFPVAASDTAGGA